MRRGVSGLCERLPDSKTLESDVSVLLLLGGRLDLLGDPARHLLDVELLLGELLGEILLLWLFGLGLLRLAFLHLAELNRRMEEIERDLDAPASPDVEERATEREGDEVLESLGNASLIESRMIEAAPA